jgi:hypothetical protein
MRKHYNMDDQEYTRKTADACNQMQEVLGIEESFRVVIEEK